MRSRATARMLSTAAVVCALCVSAAAAERGGPQRQRIITDEIMPKVAVLRGLEYRHEVPVKVVSSDDVAAYVEKIIAETMTDEELAGYERILEYLGLIEPGTDLKATIVNAYSSQVAGFYDDKDKSFSLVGNSAMPASMDNVTIAHELTHALQDQHYDLSALQKFTDHNDDASMAVMALAEGDASEVMMRYGTNSPPRGQGPVKDYTAFVSMSAGPESIPGLPLILAQDMMFPYSYGTRFVTEILKRAGPVGVNLAFRDPPVSTEQVINPEKYLYRDEPYLVELGDLAGLLPPGWLLADQAPLGQFNLGIYLSVNSGGWGVERAIEGWKGDVLAGYMGPSDGDIFIVYYSTWDSSTDAAEFAEHYGRLIETRFPDATRVYRDGSLQTWYRGENLYYMRRHGEDVLVVENVPKELAARVIMESWKAPKVPFGIARPIADRDRIQPGNSGDSREK